MYIFVLTFRRLSCKLIYMKGKEWKVVLTAKSRKLALKLPERIKEKFALLLLDLAATGPVRGDWPNYAILRRTGAHHCHLSHSYVAIWVARKNVLEIEVVYVGDREDAIY